MFASKLEDDAIVTQYSGGTTSEVVREDSTLERCKKLNIDAELQLSVLSGLVSLKGSGSYLSDERKSARSQSMSLIYKANTKKDEITIRQHKEKVDKDVLLSVTTASTAATHVVVGIQWGAVCSITCECENIENKDTTEVKAALSTKVDYIKGLVDAKVSGQASHSDEDEEQRMKFAYKCQSDISPSDKDLPVAFEEVVKFAKSLPSLTKNTNNGKGVPLTYSLMPLRNVAKMFKKKLDQQHSDIDEGTVMKCTHVLENISKKRHILYDIHHDMHETEDYVSDQSIQTIDDVFRKFEVEEARFRQGLQEVVKRARSGQDEISAIETFLSEREPAVMSLSGYNDTLLEDSRKCLSNVKLIQSWKSKGIKYIGKKNRLSVNGKRNVVVFYKTNDGNIEHNEKTQEFFLRLHSKHSEDANYGFVVVEQEIRNDIWPDAITKSSNRQFVDGKVTSEDMYTEYASKTHIIKFGTKTFVVTGDLDE